MREIRTSGLMSGEWKLSITHKWKQESCDRRQKCLYNLRHC
jgi:hypothetical protein